MKRILVACMFILLANIHSKAQFNLAWANSVNGTWNQIGTHIATDASGNIYTVGTFSYIADIDPGPGSQTVASVGGEDIYVVKQNSSGSLIWAKSFGGSDLDTPAGIGVDNSGNVYISGTYWGNIDLDPSAATYSFSPGSIEVFVLKLDASGNFVWGKSMGGGFDDNATAMCIDGSGNVYTTGTFESTMDFDPGPGSYQMTPTESSWGDIFVSKLDANGNFVWAVKFGGTGQDLPNSICLDAALNIYVTGFFRGTADFDPGAGTFMFSSVDEDDAFVSKLAPSGAFVWAKQFGGTDFQKGNSIAVDAANVYITGNFASTVDFDPGPGTYTLASTSTTAQTGAFALKLTSAGNFVWAKSIGGSQATTGTIIRVASNGNVYWAGSYYNTVDLDPGPGISNSIFGYGLFLSVLDGSGNFIESECFPYTWYSFVVNSSSEIIITGWFGSADFDPGPSTFIMNSVGATDACIVKLSPLPVGLSETDSRQLFTSIYPNPNNGNFAIDAPKGSQVKIINCTGQTVAEYVSVSEILKVNMSNAKAGVYILIINSKGKQATRKFILEN
ncbi:MAG: hypothetical protein K0S32_684 [Bacteroidetes bacterium]|jgi:hypothetical protein|nr:hypothetical protein [Bacteroidota bacterium]